MSLYVSPSLYVSLFLSLSPSFPFLHSPIYLFIYSSPVYLFIYLPLFLFPFAVHRFSSFSLSLSLSLSISFPLSLSLSRVLVVGHLRVRRATCLSPWGEKNDASRLSPGVAVFNLSAGQVASATMQRGNS